MKSVAFHTLGCKLNFSETSAIARVLENDGFVRKEFEETADVYVINTCSVTDNADKECRSLVRRIQRQAPEAIVAIIGCYAQLKPQEIAQIEGVDLVLGASEKFNLAHHLKDLSKAETEAKVFSCDIEELEGFYGTYSLSDRTRTFLKVQDGCDYNCSFCTIPLARGHSRSNTIEGVLAQIQELGAKGIKEIVLTGINLGDFGKGNDGGKRRNEDFLDLIRAIDQQDAVSRFRISSIEPNLLTDEIISFVAQSKNFMPHFHIPLQSGSDEILGKMRRRYKTDLYKSRIEKILKEIPHACIGVDVIVGFPGETDEHFAETRQFLLDLDIAYLHVFTYSERANTLAIEMEGSVPIKTRQERNKNLRNLSFQKSRYFHNQHKGQFRPVLFESKKEGIIEGYSDNYIRVKALYDPSLENQIIDWKI